MLVSTFKEFAFDVPIVVDKNMVIIKGHARREAAIRAGMDTVPYIIREDLTDAQVKAARIADNKLAESEWDYELLKIEMGGLKELGFDLEQTGFEKNIVDAILSTPEQLNYDGFGDYNGLDGGSEEYSGSNEKQDVEGKKDGRRFVFMASFGTLKNAEDFLKFIGVEPPTFNKNSETKAIDGDKHLEILEDLYARTD
jgi:hypothetical protein